MRYKEFLMDVYIGILDPQRFDDFQSLEVGSSSYEGFRLRAFDLPSVLVPLIELVVLTLGAGHYVDT